MDTKITSFTQLRSWQNAKDFAVHIYKIAGSLPATEKFGLASQLQRASVSIAANIAEGFSRNTAKEKINFYSMALGSLTEVQSHLYIAQALEFINTETTEVLIDETIDLHKMINGLKKTAIGRNT